MDAASIKKYIFDNEKIEYVLESIGCHHIQYHKEKEFYSCANYNGDNVGAINVKCSPYLLVINWTRSEFDEKSDIIFLVQYNKKCDFVAALKYLHELFNLTFSFSFNNDDVKSKKEMLDPCDIFRRFESRHRYDYTNVDDINELSDSLLNDYVPLLHVSWFKEGIMPWTAKKFSIAYSYRKKRIIIPLRYYKNGSILGINSRTTVENFEEFGIKKYFITPSYQKSLNLYGLYENKDSIQKAGYVVLVESEKSVLKRDSLNDPTLVALSGHSISEAQVDILIGLNVDIVVSMDNDVPIEEIWNICSKFYRIRNVYYTIDQWNLLGKKDSVADLSNKLYCFFMKYKKKFGVKEYEEFLKLRNNKVNHG